MIEWMVVSYTSVSKRRSVSNDMWRNGCLTEDEFRIPGEMERSQEKVAVCQCDEGFLDL